MTSKIMRLLAVLPVAALASAGCSSDTQADDRAVTIVASTNVYGDIAHEIAGNHAEVTSLITSSSQDPHEFEASAQDRLALEDADIVIKNGGGYDPFLDTLLDAANTDAIVLDAVEISGLAPKDGAEGFNEHVFYDFPTMQKVAHEISDQLSTIDPDNSTAYEANEEAVATQLKTLESSAEDLKATENGTGVAITEPVPGYLLSAVGLVNKTPAEFSEAVEEGADVPPSALQDTLDLFPDGNVAVLAYNSQAADDTTERVRAAAEKAGIPVVDFTETLPDGQAYLDWQKANLDSLAAALGRS